MAAVVTKQLLEQTIECPCCKNEFKTWKIRARAVKLIKRDTDFRGIYEGQNPVYYGIYVCPHCGYAAFEADYFKINPNEIKEVRKQISCKWKSRDYGNLRNAKDAITTYKLALVSYTILGWRQSQIGKICLRLAWLHRDIDEKVERTYMEHAINCFEKAFSTEPLDENPEEELMTLYLLGELNRRIGQYNKAVQWFGKALACPFIKKRRQIELKARDQLQATSDAYRAERAKAKAEEEAK